MAKISLRAYSKEIERSIENKRLDEAVAHCHHILKAYPKHIDTYRQFGKAYLEQQRFGDAADIFQRVLSAIPDDFISHVGMSMIREDEGNLDEALFHIQQASETQPSNIAIQDELRRLYGRRDGIEPPKIRLTRGALARMYIKGELYQQASVEIRAALAEDADRIDLQSLLAQIYIKTGKISEAIELARNILKKLPNSYDANSILATYLPANDRESDVSQYRQVINDLNPYAAYISDEYPTVDQVSEQAVSLERLEWKPELEGDSTVRQPAWAESLGLELGGGQKSVEEEIPDWMQSAGWEAGNEKNDQPQEGSDESLSEMIDAYEPESRIEKADLPDWLKEMAPQEDEFVSEAAEESETEDEDVLPWLEKILPTKPAGEIEFASQKNALSDDLYEEGSGEDLPEEERALPSWLTSMDERKPSEEADENPDWLSAPADEAKTAWDETSTEETEAKLTSEIPDWLANPTEDTKITWDEAAEEEPEAELATDIPDWLSAPAEETEAAWDETASEETQAELAAEIPDWLSAPADEVKTAWDETPEEEPHAELATEIPDWLSTPADETEAAWDETDSEETQAELAAEIPDWLSAPADEVKTAWDETPEEEPEAVLAADIPDWLSAPANEVKTTRDEASEEEPEAEPATNIPDWLSAPHEETQSAWDDASEEEPDAELAAEIPDWLSHLDEPEPSMEDTRPSKTSLAMAQKETVIEEINQLSESDESEEPQPEMETPEAELVTDKQTDEAEAPNETDEEDQAFAWLEGLAARQGTDQETLFSGEAQTQETPDWILESAGETEPIGEVDLENLDTETEAAPQSELEWLAEESEENLPIAESSAISTEPEELIEPGQVEAAISELEEMDDAFAWLESLAAKQGADEALLLKPEDRQSETPEWVRLESQEQPAEPEGIQAALQESEEIPEQAPISAELETDTDFSVQPEIETQETVIAWSRAEPGPATLLSEPEEISQSEDEWQESEPVEIETPEAAVTSEFPLEAEPIASEILGEDKVTEEQYETEAIVSENPEETGFTEKTSGPEAIEFETPEDADAKDELLKSEAVATETLDEIESTEEPSEPEDDEVEASEESQPEDESLDNEEMPELPAWLADVEPTPEDEVLEWTPPSRTLKPVELNQASLVELERLPGVGFRLAQEIIDYRDQHGPFDNLDQLAEVPGADELNLEALAPILILPEPAASTVEAADSKPVLAFDQAADLPELEPARQALQQGDLEAGLQVYNKLIEGQQALPDIIQDLEEAVKVHPDSFELWLTMGDAYQRSDQVRQALTAYLKAQELLS